MIKSRIKKQFLIKFVLNLDDMQSGKSYRKHVSEQTEYDEAAGKARPGFSHEDQLYGYDDHLQFDEI